MDHPVVLVVDPDPDSRKILSALLAHADYEVRQSADAGSALDLGRRVRPDVIVGEHPLRLVDGRILCDALRDDPTTKTIPFVALTARAMPEEVDDASLTHELVFTKPPRFTEVVRAISRIVEPARQYR